MTATSNGNLAAVAAFVTGRAVAPSAFCARCAVALELCVDPYDGGTIACSGGASFYLPLHFTRIVLTI